MAAAGRTGVVGALLVYVLLTSILKPIDTGLFLKDHKYFSDAKKPIHANDLKSLHTSQVNKHFGFGRHIIAMTFVYPSLYNWVTKPARTVSKQQQSHTLIIAICLLLSGDIHQCPGPLNQPAEDGTCTAFTTRRSNSTFYLSAMGGLQSAGDVASSVAGISVSGDGGVCLWIVPGVLASAPAGQPVLCPGASRVRRFPVFLPRQQRSRGLSGKEEEGEPQSLKRCTSSLIPGEVARQQIQHTDDSQVFPDKTQRISSSRVIIAQSPGSTQPVDLKPTNSILPVNTLYGGPVMRFFGIPCRVVTNFSSAHDNNVNLTIERYQSEDGIVGKETKDSIWNFHVWVEGWMRRPAMSKDGKYDGWQVLDPTPQEQSQGVFCCGPSPKAAILNGDTDIKYDTPFVFAEVNADSVDWLVKPDGSLEKIEASTDLVGQHISTKAVGSDARVDITNTYKPEEGKIDERVVFRRAVFKHFKHLNKIREEEKKKRETETLEIHTLETEIREMERNGIPNRIGNVSTGETDGETTEVILPPPKVSIRFEEVSKPINGKDVSQKLVLSSESTADRPLIINIAVQAMNYTGHLAGNIQGEKLEKTLLPGKDLTMPIVVPFSVYSKPMLECDIMKISVLVKDKEKPDHPYLREVDLVLLDPPISVTIFGKVKLKTPANAEISFMNPVNETLKNCTLTISGTGLWKGEYEIKLGDLKPNRRIRLKFYIVPYKSGERTLTADFDCSLFRDIKGLCTVTVRP